MLIRISPMFSTPVLFSIITKVNVASNMPIKSDPKSPLKIWAGDLLYSKMARSEADMPYFAIKKKDIG
jgi:hypothetical protein